jgi:hypothetical protein
VAPAEDELVEAVLESGLLHADETSWPERGHGLWLWVFTAAAVTLYYIAGRGKELLESLRFQGWLMTDGWISYRGFPRRLRCWAHLIRKARGLTESYQREARAFGRPVLDTLKALMAAVYAAREGPPADLPRQHAASLAKLRAACEQAQRHDHAKTHALAVELLNDWDAIFQVLAHPELPLSRVEVWRGSRRSRLSVPAPFVWRCLTSRSVVPFPHPARRTRRADFPQRALFQGLRPSHSNGRRGAATGVSVPTYRDWSGYWRYPVPCLPRLRINQIRRRRATPRHRGVVDLPLGYPHAQQRLGLILCLQLLLQSFQPQVSCCRFVLGFRLQCRL